jgi:membrane associated rhomboid family serine protease
MMKRFDWWAVKIAAVCVIVFFLQNVYDITGDFALRADSWMIKPWTFVTSMFLHGSFEHLFYNMFALVMFGSILEKIIGSKKFLLLYLVSGIIAGLGGTFFYESAIGASGAIYGVLGSLATLRPRMVVYAMGVPMPMIVAVIIWAALDFVGMLAPGQIAYAAHLCGLAAGVLISLSWIYEFKENRIQRKPLEKLPEEEVRAWEDAWLR